MSTSEYLRDGQIFGRYQIVRMLGQGGMGAVYEAVHAGLKKRFAIKTLLPSIAESPEARARFLREGEAASRINHPNVVDVSDVGMQDGIPYLVMEFFEGETLGDFMARKGALDVVLAVDLLLPTLSAVSAGHDQGVIHRDLKPQNVFLARSAWGDRTPKILDFGVSKLIGGENPALTGTLSVLGTASYMSPEQARGAKVVDARSDQYALGLIFYEMLTGARAYSGDSPLEVLHKITTGAIAAPRAARPDLPAAIDAIVMKMLAMQPADRYASLRLAARELLPFAGERTRLMFREAFDDLETARRPTGAMAVADARGGGTMVLPADGEAASSGVAQGPVAGGTRMLPQPKVDTTLGQVAAETRPHVVAPPRRGARVATGVALAAAAVLAIVVARSGRARPPAVAVEPVPAASTPAASTPVDLPRRETTPVTPPTAQPPALEVAPPPVAKPTAQSDHAVTARREGQEEAPAHAHADGHSPSTHASGHHAKRSTASEQAPTGPTDPIKRRGANNAPILE